MPAEERVVIHVDIDTDLAKGQADIEALFRSMETRAKLAERKLDQYERKMAKVDKTSNKTAKSIRKTDRAFSGLMKTLKRTGSVLGKFLAMFTKFSFIGVAIEIALVSAALLGVKLALVSGRLAMQAYRASLVGLGVAAQGVAVVLGSVAAAMRQINEVKLAPNVGGAQQSAQVLRSTMNDQMLSFYGMEGVSTAVNALARGGVSQEAGYTQILRQLGDYTADPKELADLASVYATVSKSGQIDSESLAKFGDINPALAAGITELSGLSGDELEKVLGEGGTGVGLDVLNAVLAGTAEATDEWEGQLKRLNNTVMGTLKGMLPRMFQLFADLGAPFLDTIQQTLTKIEQIIENTVMRIRGSVVSFGLDSMIPGILSGFEKLSDLFVRIVNQAGTMEGWMTTVSGWWDTIRNYFVDMQRIFESLEPAADALIRILGPQWKSAWEGMASLVRGFGDLLIANEKKFTEFSEAVGNIFTAIFDWFGNANERFADALPVWTDFANMIADDLVPVLGDIFDMLHEASQTVLPQVTGLLSALAGAFSSIAGALTQIMKIPGIGLIMAAMMFKSTRGLVKGGFGLAKGALAPAAGRAAFGMRQTFGTLLTGGAMGASAAPASAATMGGLGALVAAPAALGAVSGTWMGRMAGRNFEGTTGKAMGAGAGALTGAGTGALAGAAIGTMVGPIGTAAGAVIGGTIGAIAGGITGWYGAQGAQDAKESGEKAAEIISTAYLTALDRGLEKGQNREILTGILEQFDADTQDMRDKIMLGEGSLASRTADSFALYLDRMEARELIEIEVAGKTDILNDKLDVLKSVTGKTGEELEHMANIMGVDLTNATIKFLDAALAMGALSEYDLSVEGIRDYSNQALTDSMYGSGSFFEQQFTAPEQENTLNALLNEAKDVLDSGGKLTGDMAKGIVDNMIATGQTKGMEGTDLMAMMTDKLPEADALIGADGVLTGMVADVQRAVEMVSNPETNPAYQGLLLATMDEVRTKNEGSEEYLNQLGLDKFKEKVEAINQLPLQDRDEALAAEIERTRYEGLFESMTGLDQATTDLSTKFGYLADQIDWIIGGREGPKPQPSVDPGAGRTDSQGRTGFGAGSTPSQYATPVQGTRGGRAGRGSQPSQIVQSVSKTATVNASTQNRQNISMSFSGLGIQEAMPRISAEIAKQIRNANQRRPRTEIPRFAWE